MPQLSTQIQLHKGKLPEGWDTYANLFPEATWYHGNRWKILLEDIFGYESFYLSAEGEEGLAGILPLSLVTGPLFGKLLVSSPCANYGGPLAHDQETIRMLIAEAKRIANSLGVRCLELRTRTAFSDSELETRVLKQTFELELPANEEALYSSLSKEIRGMLRKGDSAGAVTRVGGLELLDDFYAVFSTRMRDMGTPVYPKKMFNRLFQRFSEEARFVCVSFKQKPIAGGVLICDRQRAEIPWMVSRDREFGFSSGYAVFWHSIREAIRRGCSRFDFGPSRMDSGSIFFKKKWGAQAIPLTWQYFPVKGDIPDSNPRNRRFNWPTAAWRRLPLWAANRLGPQVVRWIP